MTYLALLLSLFIVDLLAAMSPGPNFLVVTQAAIRCSLRVASAVVAGILTANLLWSLGVVFGLSTLFALAPWLYGAMKLLGGAYLICLGVSLWGGQNRSALSPELALQRAFPAAYARGLLTALANPKSVVYFGSIFAVFMAPATPLWVKALAVLIVLFNTVVWYGAVAATFANRRIQQGYAAVQRPINRATGAVMIGFGAGLIVIHD